MLAIVPKSLLVHGVAEGLMMMSFFKEIKILKPEPVL